MVRVSLDIAYISRGSSQKIFQRGSENPASQTNQLDNSGGNYLLTAKSGV